MTVERIGATAACVLVAAGLAAGFALIGSPQHTRALALDERRSEDLLTIAAALHNRYESHPRVVPKRLPPDLRAFRSDGSDATRDPVSGAAYHYARLDARHYRLCTTFSLRDDKPSNGYGPLSPHPAGAACFRFDLDDSWPFGQATLDTGVGSSAPIPR